jgi:uncharacterized protein YjiS (DUF1127 family)
MAPDVYRQIRLAFSMLALWPARASQRRQLLELIEAEDRHLLADMGLTREAALAEAHRPFWQPWPAWRPSTACHCGHVHGPHAAA